MENERWKTIESIYHAAADMEKTQRNRFLENACQGDGDLQREIESLLLHDELDGSSLDRQAPYADLRRSTQMLGTKLAHYEITSHLGSGGMGDVYQATDSKLGRSVAVKFLPEVFARDANRLARFEREARVLASLNHPNIAGIYDLNEAAGMRFLVLELVEGETLADRLRRGPLPVDEALAIAIQIAEGVQAAHEKGITHRDLKPANIKMTPDGRVKVLDFGLAKVLAPAGDAVSPDSPTLLSASSTQPNVILGTAAYMSPEQIQGKVVDEQSDVWAFACVLFEMLTGKPAFGGESTAEILGSILKSEPDWAALPGTTTEPVRRMLRRCLQKDRKLRLHNIADARIEIEEAREHLSEAIQVPAPRQGNRITIAFALAGLITGALLTSAIVDFFPRSRNVAGLPVTRSLIAVAPADQLRADAADILSQGHLSRRAMVFTPDGRSIVFSGARNNTQQLYVRRLDQLEASPIAGTEEGGSLFMSPDSKWVGFWAQGALKKASLDRKGSVTTICETPPIFGASWGSNDIIVFDREFGGLWQIAASGGAPKALTTLDATSGEFSHRLPQLLPGGNAVMFTITHSLIPVWDDTDVVVQSLATNQRKLLVQGGADATYLPSGHVVYVRRGTVMAAPFDLTTLALKGGAASVIDDVMQAANMPDNKRDSGAGQFSVSESGSLVYVTGGIYSFGDRSLAWVSRTGNIEQIAAPPRAYVFPRLSPDGSKILVSTQGDRNVWVYDVLRGATIRLTTVGRSMAASWTADGKRIIFGSSMSGPENIFSKPADNSAASERLTTSPNNQRPSSVAFDGEVFFTESRPGNHDIWALPLTGDRQPHAIVKTRFDEQSPAISPDGQWLAYSSNETGRAEVYVQRYPGPGPEVSISGNGGSSPAWRKDGRELFYMEPVLAPGARQYTIRMMAVNVATAASTFTADKPRMLFQGAFGGGIGSRNYDVSPDGQRFLMVLGTDRPSIKPAHIILVQNWFEELKRLAPNR